MGIVSGMLTLAAVAAAPTAPGAEGASNKPIVCQAQVATVDALGWRALLGPSGLESVSRQGKATVWVAPRSAKAVLLGQAGTQVTAAPCLAMTPEHTASVEVGCPKTFIRHQAVGSAPVMVLGEGQLGKSPVPVPMPEIQIEQGQVEEKFEFFCTPRRLDQGTLARIRLADSHVVALHKVPTAEEAGIVDVDFNITDGSATVGSLVESAAAVLDVATNSLAPSSGLVHLAGMVVDTIDAQSNPPVTLGKVEIPEVVAATVEGEWLVPNGSVLVVSFGVHTGADAQGKAVVRDRVAILDFAGECSAPGAPGAPVAPNPAMALFPAGEVVRVCEASGPPPVAIALSQLNMPTVPTRSLPEAVDKNGQVIDLPPLPEAYAAADLNQISPGSPLATPQAPLVRAGQSQPTVDPQLARTTFEAPTAPASRTDLGALVEGFLRRGMTSANCSADAAASCPAQACPGLLFQDADGDCPDCPECPATNVCPATTAAPTAAPSKPAEMSVRGAFAAAFQNPGTTETQYLPLGKGLALEVRVRIVPTPEDAADAQPGDQTRTSAAAGADKLLAESENLRQAGDEWQRFWFLDQPSHLKPFRIPGKPNP